MNSLFELKNTNSLLCGGVKPGNPRCLLSGSRGKYTVNFYHPYISLIIVEYRSLCSYIITYIIISFYFSLSECCPNVHKFTAETSQVSRNPGEFWFLPQCWVSSQAGGNWDLSSTTISNISSSTKKSLHLKNHPSIAKNLSTTNTD